MTATLLADLLKSLTCEALAEIVRLANAELEQRYVPEMDDSNLEAAPW